MVEMRGRLANCMQFVCVCVVMEMMKLEFNKRWRLSTMNRMWGSAFYIKWAQTLKKSVHTQQMISLKIRWNCLFLFISVICINNLLRELWASHSSSIAEDSMPLERETNIPCIQTVPVRQSNVNGIIRDAFGSIAIVRCNSHTERERIKFFPRSKCVI